MANHPNRKSGRHIVKPVRVWDWPGKSRADPDRWQPRVHLLYGGRLGEVFECAWQETYATRDAAIARAREFYPDAEDGGDTIW